MRVALIYLLCFFISSTAVGQTTFTAQVNSNKVGVNEKFQLIFTITNGAGLKEFRPPTLTDFKVVGGPNQSNKTQIVGTSIVNSVSISYLLQPKSTGKFTIGSAYIKSADKTYSSLPISIEVLDAPPSNNNTSKTQQESTPENIQKYLSDNIIIKTVLSDQDLYVGESFNVFLKLCVPKDPSISEPQGFQNIKSPAYDGFYVEYQPIPNTPFSTETINGKTYKVYTFNNIQLTPNRSGNLILDPYTSECIIRVLVKKQKQSSGDPLQDMMEEFFGSFSNVSYREFSVPVASKTTAVQVKPLPEGAPAEFMGAVGKFGIKSVLSNTTTRTDEPLTYKIAITGTGNLPLIPAPQLDLPPGWETYDPKISQSKDAKVFEYMLLPRSPGKFTLPAIAWSYFDPVTKKYTMLRTDAFPVEVTPGPGYNPDASDYTSKKERVESLTEDIRYIHKEDPTYGDPRKHINRALLIALCCLPIASGIGLSVFTRRLRLRMADTKTVRAAAASSVAQTRLRKAELFAQQNNGRAFYDETIRALWGYLSDKLHIPQNNLNRDTIRDVLRSRSVQSETIDAFMQTLDTCEMSLFAPQIQDNALQRVYADATKIIDQLENELR